MTHTFLPDRLKEVQYWIEERERVRAKHDAKVPGEWSGDPAFQTIRFCNVYREHDRVTRWIRENWRDPFADHPMLPLAMVIARLVNWPDTLLQLGFPINGWDPEWFQRVLAKRKADGNKVWTNAYMVTGGYSEGGESKEVIIARVIAGAKFAINNFPHPESLKGWFQLLSTPGLGPFLRGQIIADLKYTPKLEDAPDWWTWCAPGPGSQQGLSILTGKPPSKTWRNDDFMEAINELRLQLPVEIHAQDTQNVLCEYSKWYKFTKLSVPPKNKYVRV